MNFTLVLAGQDNAIAPRPFRFPIERALAAPPVPAAEHPALEALHRVSRRINDLARELNCLGYFDDDDRPRAA